MDKKDIEEMTFDVDTGSMIVTEQLPSDASDYSGDSSNVFDGENEVGEVGITVRGKNYVYVPFGTNNQLPYNIMQLVSESTVMSQNKLFNVLCCYGQGLKYMDAATKKPSDDKDIRLFQLHNNFMRFFMEQITDMKYFFFAVSVIVLNKAGNKIVNLRHKEACYCRFEKSKNGRIEHVFFANWRDNTAPDDIEVIPLLDDLDPLGDLQSRMGVSGKGGQTVKQHGYPETKDRKFAIVSRFPTPGYQYYPIPYYTSVFRDGWYDISQLIGIGKRAKLKNKASISYHVEIHRDYWREIFMHEHITDSRKQKERKDKEKENIKKFLLGIQNQGKVWISGFYTTPDGKETHMVQINKVDSSPEGGDYSADIEEANNVMCYADNTHPNLVGATPGKSQMNNSGSDKRELFTLKQAIEKAFHDVLEQVHDVIIWFNGWEDKIYPDVPMIMLTTLDQNTDAKTATEDGTDGQDGQENKDKNK